MTACTYCDHEVERHTPVTVYNGVKANGREVGVFCNYACLQQFVEERDLIAGACCEIDIP